MAFSATLVDRISFGNMKLRIYNLTDVQTGGSTFKTGLGTVWAVKASNNTDAKDSFIEVVGDGTNGRDGQTTREQVTFTSATADDDGQAWIFGR